MGRAWCGVLLSMSSIILDYTLLARDAPLLRVKNHMQIFSYNLDGTDNGT